VADGQIRRSRDVRARALRPLYGSVKSFLKKLVACWLLCWPTCVSVFGLIVLNRSILNDEMISEY